MLTQPRTQTVCTSSFYLLYTTSSQETKNGPKGDLKGGARGRGIFQRTMHHLGSEVPEANQPQAVASQPTKEHERKATDHLYWARSSSTNAAPPPKAISAEEAKKMAESSSLAGGSAWNQGGSTWEEHGIM